jgi:tetrapyrrole methylase family protein/MazG family protein
MSLSLRHTKKLLKILAQLRAPNGCPWDRRQTNQSLKHNLIEEAYEAADALDARDMRAFQEELGDLLMVLAFHAQIASEKGRFTFDDLARGVSKKLVRRHPHVFGKGKKLRTPEEVKQQWEQIKRTEKSRKSIVEDVPRHLPALMRAHQLQKKVARVGFDWKNVSDVVAKVEEEVRELKGALVSGDKKQFEDEVGDLLFAAVNLARYENLDAEELLHRCIHKFAQRFQYVERAVARRGKKMEDCPLRELDALWEEAKHRLERPRRASRSRGRKGIR